MPTWTCGERQQKTTYRRESIYYIQLVLEKKDQAKPVAADHTLFAFSSSTHHHIYIFLHTNQTLRLFVICFLITNGWWWWWWYHGNHIEFSWSVWVIYFCCKTRKKNRVLFMAITVTMPQSSVFGSLQCTTGQNDPSLFFWLLDMARSCYIYYCAVNCC